MAPGPRYGEAPRWPMLLQSLLGEGFRVLEEGFGGRTIAFDDPVEGGFKSGMQYLPPCLLSHNPLDMIVVMLGTNDTKQRFLVICQNKGAIPNMPYDAMVELPAYIGKNGPEVISRDNIPLFQQGLMMQPLNSEKLVVEATIEGSYEKALKAFTLNKTVPSMKVAKEVLDDMIEANKGFWPELN